MVRKLWSKEDTKKLEEMYAAGKSDGVIAAVLGKSEGSVRSKRKREGLDDDEHKNSGSSSSDNLILPAEIPSVETVLKIAVAAMMALQTSGLSKGCLLYTSPSPRDRS